MAALACVCLLGCTGSLIGGEDDLDGSTSMDLGGGVSIHVTVRVDNVPADQRADVAILCDGHRGGARCTPTQAGSATCDTYVRVIPGVVQRCTVDVATLQGDNLVGWVALRENAFEIVPGQSTAHFEVVNLADPQVGKRARGVEVCATALVDDSIEVSADPGWDRSCTWRAGRCLTGLRCAFEHADPQPASITLTATSTSGALLWRGACSGPGPCVMTLPAEGRQRLQAAPTLTADADLSGDLADLAAPADLTDGASSAGGLEGTGQVCTSSCCCQLGGRPAAGAPGAGALLLGLVLLLRRRRRAER